MAGSPRDHCPSCRSQQVTLTGAPSGVSRTSRMGPYSLRVPCAMSVLPRGSGQGENQAAGSVGVLQTVRGLVLSWRHPLLKASPTLPTQPVSSL